MSTPISRRRFLRTLAGGIAGLGVFGIGASAYATRVEPYWLGVTAVAVPLRHLPPAFDGFTIAHISDLHLGDWTTAEHLQEVVAQINALAPDLVALTGDIASRAYPGLQGDITAFLRDLHAGEGVAATLGNHDHWLNARLVRQAILDAGAWLLLNTHTAIRRGADTLYIAGVDDVWERQDDLDAALAGIPPGPAATVLLAHEPDFADEVAATGRIGLQLSGHSHGGQVRLPGIGAPVLPWLGRRYDMGLYLLDGMHLYVNRGIGMTAPFVRFNCPPEITLITLTAPRT